MIISAIAFTAAFIGMVFALFRVHRFYRGAGFSLDKARKEFSDGVMADRNVQQVLGLCTPNAFWQMLTFNRCQNVLGTYVTWT